MDVLRVDSMHKACVRWDALDLQHFAHFEDSLGHSLRIFKVLADLFRQIVGRKPLKVGQSIVKRGRECTEHQISRKYSSLLMSDGGILLHDCVQVHQGIGVEKIISALEKDGRQLSEEDLQVTLDVLSILLADQTEYDLTGSVGVSPLLHLNCVLNLHFSEIEKVLLTLRVVKLDRVGNFFVEELIRVFLGLDQLRVVIVQRVCKAPVFTLATELE